MTLTFVLEKLISYFPVRYIQSTSHSLLEWTVRQVVFTCREQWEKRIADSVRYNANWSCWSPDRTRPHQTLTTTPIRCAVSGMLLKQHSAQYTPRLCIIRHAPCSSRFLLLQHNFHASRPQCKCLNSQGCQAELKVLRQ